MITARKDGRIVRAMIMDEPATNVIGVVQCGIEGCEAHMPLFAGPNDNPPHDQVMWFLEHHKCDPRRYAAPLRPRTRK